MYYPSGTDYSKLLSNSPYLLGYLNWIGVNYDNDITEITFDTLNWVHNISSDGGTVNKYNCSYTITAHFEMVIHWI